ncbi:MAG: hypothetical protein WC760_03805 [Bacteroidia bacterium]|jgi:hypothetical protein
MKRFFRPFFIFTLLFVWRGMLLQVSAQNWVAGQNVTLNVNDYALIATNNAPVSMSLTSATAGAAVTQVSNSSLYVKISSRVPGNTRRQITARISSGSVPTATTLTLLPAACTTTNSGGVLGTPISSAITLTGSDQPIVNQIGTCYTGAGNTDGYQITFTWRVVNPTTSYQQLASGSYNVTVVFTLTAHDGNN